MNMNRVPPERLARLFSIIDENADGDTYETLAAWGQGDSRKRLVATRRPEPVSARLCWIVMGAVLGAIVMAVDCVLLLMRGGR